MPTVLPGCTTNCHAAKGEKCKCACGGRYHGIVRPGELLPQTEKEAEYILTEGYLPGKQFDLFANENSDDGLFQRVKKWISKQLRLV